MSTLSQRSLDKLHTCDTRLQDVVRAAIKRIDFTVLCGHRGENEQNDAFERGFSKLRWPKSKHNSNPSKAVDLAPYPINWEDIGRFKALGIIMVDEARKLHVPLRWGADWNRNGNLSDDKLKDWPHFELDD